MRAVALVVPAAGIAVNYPDLLFWRNSVGHILPQLAGVAVTLFTASFFVERDKPVTLFVLMSPVYFWFTHELFWNLGFLSAIRGSSELGSSAISKLASLNGPYYLAVAGIGIFVYFAYFYLLSMKCLSPIAAGLWGMFWPGYAAFTAAYLKTTNFLISVNVLSSADPAKYLYSIPANLYEISAVLITFAVFSGFNTYIAVKMARGSNQKKEEKNNNRWT